MKTKKAWKKVETSRSGGVTTIFYRHPVTENEVRIISNDEKDWIVLAERVKPFSLTQLRANLTKAKAIAYARGYMKRHANGRL